MLFSMISAEIGEGVEKSEKRLDVPYLQGVRDGSGYKGYNVQLPYLFSHCAQFPSAKE